MHVLPYIPRFQRNVFFDSGVTRKVVIFLFALTIAALLSERRFILLGLRGRFTGVGAVFFCASFKKDR